jgi:hypothetical protein
MPLLIAPARSGRQPGMSHHRRHSYPAQALMLCVCALRCGCRRCAGAGGAAVIRPLIVQFGGPDRESMLDAALLAEPFCGEPRSTDEHAPRSTDRNAPLRPLWCGQGTRAGRGGAGGSDAAPGHRRRWSDRSGGVWGAGRPGGGHGGAAARAQRAAEGGAVSLREGSIPTEMHFSDLSRLRIAYALREGSRSA